MASNEEFVQALESRLRLKRPCIERLLGLPQRYLSDPKNLELPETKVLLEMIYVMPFLIEVAEAQFNPSFADAVVMREAYGLRCREILNDLEKRSGE